MIRTNSTRLATVVAADMAKYQGQWIAYRADDGRVVAGSEKLDELRRRVLDAGEDVNKVILTRVPADGEDMSLGGLELQRSCSSLTFRIRDRRYAGRHRSRSAKLRPLISVRLIGPTGNTARLGHVLVDTGSVDSIFPLGIAEWIGAEPIRPPPSVQWTVRWRGASHPLEFARIEIELTDATGVLLRWPSIVVFSSAPLPYDGLLGNHGCLTFLNAAFRGEDQLLEIEPASRFPGVQIPS